MEDIHEYPPSQDIQLPSKKRRRRSVAAPKKRQREDKRGLCELNLDELYIIFTYIYPMDLLNLARTCKSLRGILMHKSSRYLWKSAICRIEGLPPCPADLTEPQYTNLVFYNRCHICGKAAQTVLWKLRRRYCPPCKAERLFLHSCCDKFIRDNNVLPCDTSTIGNCASRWLDREQVDSFMREYHSSSDKAMFLNEKREQCQVISLHATECETWQRRKGRMHRFDLQELRKERQTRIFDLLRQRGYGLELRYFSENEIEKSDKTIFKDHGLLMDSELERMWPELARIMDKFRSRRLRSTLHFPRRLALNVEYDSYVTNPAPDSPQYDFLPHAVDCFRFPPFIDLIRAPEGVKLHENLIATAFSKLPALVDEWVQKLGSEIAELVKIPAQLSSDIVSGDARSSLADLKLRLACAVFHVGGTGAFAYPEVLSVTMGDGMTVANVAKMWASMPSLLTMECEINSGSESGDATSIHDRYGLQFLDEAPYIVYACGLDPNVATVADMDHRNARLRCLVCGGHTLIMNWKHAIWHARFYHCISFGLLPLSQSPRWERVSDEHIDAIQAVERSVQKAFPPDWTRCLLCRPRVGDARLYEDAVCHLNKCHGVAKDGIQEGTHYKLLGIRDACVVEMIEVMGQPTFRELHE